jgi:dipeptidyl aminopeptidase/acylaminoacyl peptidase
MKKCIGTMLFFLAISIISSAQNKPVESIFLFESSATYAPAFAGKANIKGDTFSENELLKNATTPSGLALINGSVTGDYGLAKAAWTLQKDANGSFFAPANQASSTVGYALFFVDALSFTKGSVVVKSPLPFEVYIDGLKATEKLSTENKSANAPFKFARQQHQVLVKYLRTNSLKDTAKLNISLDIPQGKQQQLLINSSKRILTINDILEGYKVASASISASGKYASVTLSKVDPQSGKASRLTKYINLTTGKEVGIPTYAAAPQWMPNGSRLWWIDATNDNALTVYNLEDGTQQVVAKNISAKLSYTWAPNEKYLVGFGEDDVKIEEKSPMQQIVTPEDRQPGWRDRSFLYKVDLATGQKARVTYGNKTTYLSDISSDSKWLLVSVQNEVYTERPFSTTDVFKINAETFAVDTLLKGQKFIGGVKISPNGEQLLVLGGPEAFDKAGLNVKKSPIANSYDNQAFIYQIATGNVTPITKNFDPSVDNAEWSNDGKSVVMLVSKGDRNLLYQYSLAGASYSQLPTSCEVISDFTLAKELETMVYFGQNASYPAAAYTYSFDNQSSVLIADPAKDKMAQIELGEMRDWSFKAKDGSTIEGRFYLPPHFDPSKKYPMIVNYYGGTTPVERTFEGRYPLHLYAAMGYVVYVLQPSGATGYGQEFSARHVNAWGKQTADEIIEGTKKFIAEHSFVDASKVGCIGASYGGFMTQYLQTKTNIFAAAISHAGISDITSYWGEGYWGYTYSSGASANSYPWNNQQLYINQSPLFSAQKINTPILFLHGQMDTNVPIGESIQMYNALKILGKAAELITVEGENHTIAGYKTRIAWNNTIFAWFDRYLKGESEWWNELYPKKNL